MSTHQNSSCWKSVGLAALRKHDFSSSFPRDIVLPVAALLRQYKENPESSIIRHFDLMFIQQSVGKLPSNVSHCTKLRSELDLMFVK
jgi:hypothetical protein